jgi:hypothetical protein
MVNIVLQMYIIDYKEGACHRARAIAGLSNLYRAITAFPHPASIPNVEFIIDIEDTPTDNVPDDRIVWAWNRPNNKLNTWIMPDFDGWAVSAYALPFRGYNIKKHA